MGERAREREAERAQAALHARRQNAGAKEYDDRSDRYRFPASSPGPITPLARADSLYYSRNRKVALPWSWQAGRPPSRGDAANWELLLVGLTLDSILSGILIYLTG